MNAWRTRFFGLILTLGTACSPGWAQDPWLLVSERGGWKTYLDTSRVKKVTPHLRRVWVKTVQPTGSEMLCEQEFDLSKARLKALQSSTFSDPTLMPLPPKSLPAGPGSGAQILAYLRKPGSQVSAGQARALKTRRSQGATFSRQGGYFLNWEGGGKLQLCSVADGSPIGPKLQAPDLDAYLHKGKFSANGKVVGVAGRQKVCFWQVPAGRSLGSFAHKHEPPALDLNSDGSLALLHHAESKVVQVIGTAKGAPVWTLKTAGTPYFTPNRQVAVVKANLVEVYSLANTKPLYTLKEGGSGFLLPDGRLALTASRGLAVIDFLQRKVVQRNSAVPAGHVHSADLRGRQIGINLGSSGSLVLDRRENTQWKSPELMPMLSQEGTTVAVLQPDTQRTVVSLYHLSSGLRLGHVAIQGSASPEFVLGRRAWIYGGRPAGLYLVQF